MRFTGSRRPKPQHRSGTATKDQSAGGGNSTMIYKPNFISAKERREILTYLESLHPIWEMRFSASNPPPAGEENRQLLRPVYWLGNWQFACLDYYHPPKGLHNRCVTAESFPPSLQRVVDVAEKMVHEHYHERDVPRDWHLNTCLINFYGSKKVGDTWIDTARVGEHKDFEPGPVVSLSLGEKAYFQFVESHGKGQSSRVVISQWLNDSDLQIFAGDRLKKRLFHRVQRVEESKKFDREILGPKIENFRTRRINFTFRYVPKDHFVDFQRLPENLKKDITPYVQELGEHSDFFRDLLASDC